MSTTFEQNIDVKKVRERLERHFERGYINDVLVTKRICWMVHFISEQPLDLENHDPDYLELLVQAALEDIQILRAGNSRRR